MAKTEYKSFVMYVIRGWTEIKTYYVGYISHPDSSIPQKRLVMDRRVPQAPNPLQEPNNKLFILAKVFRRLTNECSTSLRKTDVMEIGWQFSWQSIGPTKLSKQMWYH